MRERRYYRLSDSFGKPKSNTMGIQQVLREAVTQGITFIDIRETGGEWRYFLYCADKLVMKGAGCTVEMTRHEKEVIQLHLLETNSDWQFIGNRWKLEDIK